MRWSLAAAAFAVALPMSVFAQSSGIKRTLDPALSPDGSTVAFQWQGDLWTVSAAGGMATRLTVHPATESFPVWSRDGKSIVFASNRFGSIDVFRANSDGTGIQRLTFDSGTDYPTSTGPNGEIYGYSSAFGRMDVFRIGPNGGDLVRLTGHSLEMEFLPSLTPDGKKVVFCAGGSAGHWRKPGHNGANTSDIWIADNTVPLSNMKQLTKDDVLDMFPAVISNDEALVMSNKGGQQNIYRLNLKSGAKTQITKFTSGTIRALTVSADGSKATFQKDSEIYLLDVKSGVAKPVTINAPSDSRRLGTTEFNLATGASGMSVSPNGKLMAITVRGDIFVLPAAGGTTKRLTTSVRPESNPIWLDDETILHVAAGDGSHRFFQTVKLDGTVKEFYRDAEDVGSPSLSPDGKWLAFHQGERSLMVMPKEGGTPVKVFEGGFALGLRGGPSFTWTPDSEWLAIERQDSRSVGLYVAKRDGSANRLVTRAGKGATTPILSADGKHFVFSGVEGLDYSEARQGGSAIYVVDLVPQALTFTEDDLDKINEEPKKETPTVKVTIDDVDLNWRRRRLPIEAFGLWPMASGASVYTNIDSVFSIVDLATGTTRPVTGVTGTVNDVLIHKGRTFINQQGRISILTPQGATPVRYSATMRINLAEEELALFEEAWWALDRFFYDPKMHGKDWDGIRKEFAALVPHATSREDFYSLMGEMVERLDSSHQGATSSEAFRPEVSEQTGQIGVEWDWAQVEKGRYVVASVMPFTPANHAESRLRVGDAVTHVNGTALGKGTTYAELMRGSAGKKVALTITRGGSTQTIQIKPTSSGAMASIRYQDWVNQNKKMVDELSKGQLGYIHIEGMDAPSLDVFLKEIATDLEGKKGVIVDVRYNGGGFTSHIILNIMRKTPWLIRTERSMPGSSMSENQYRGNALELPAACLTNEYSFSNAEIFSEGFQRMKLGPVIGEPTGGGVIGTSSLGLWDGGMIRMPASGAFAVDGENLEGNGRKPNIDIPWDAVAWATQGRDTQLERAVQELLKLLPRG